MKSISKFLSGYLFVSLIAPVCANASECTNCINFRTERTVKLPCGCDNHVYCLRSKAEHGGYVRGDDQYRCLNPKCPNSEKGKFDTAENFWKYMWENSPADEANWNYKASYKSNCGHKTPGDIAEGYRLWLKNRNNGRNNRWWDANDLANATRAWDINWLCAICGTGKEWIDYKMG